MTVVLQGDNFHGLQCTDGCFERVRRTTLLTAQLAFVDKCLAQPLHALKYRMVAETVGLQIEQHHTGDPVGVDEGPDQVAIKGNGALCVFFLRQTDVVVTVKFDHTLFYKVIKDVIEVLSKC